MHLHEQLLHSSCRQACAVQAEHGQIMLNIYGKHYHIPTMHTRTGTAAPSSTGSCELTLSDVTLYHLRLGRRLSSLIVTGSTVFSNSSWFNDMRAPASQMQGHRYDSSL